MVFQSGICICINFSRTNNNKPGTNYQIKLTKLPIYAFKNPPDNNWSDEEIYYNDYRARSHKQNSMQIKLIVCKLNYESGE